MDIERFKLKKLDEGKVNRTASGCNQKQVRSSGKLRAEVPKFL
jgi:hypothetical protein